MPIEQYCKALTTWQEAILKGILQGNTELKDLYPHIETVFTAIMKSNLLCRLLYQGERLRTIPCPEHKGQWSGWAEPGTCECQSGVNVTGWLPNEGSK